MNQPNISVNASLLQTLAFFDSSFFFRSPCTQSSSSGLVRLSSGDWKDFLERKTELGEDFEYLGWAKVKSGIIKSMGIERCSRRLNNRFASYS